MIIIKKLCSFLWVFLLQLTAGCLLIFIVDKIIARCDYDLYVGINLMTGSVVGILGIPGVAMLFIVALIIKNIA